jgi:sec-independent protein translocase protein TatA
MSGEHLIVLAIVLLIFGPKRLPELGNTMGKAFRNFKDGMQGVEEAKFRRIDEAAREKAEQPAKNQAAEPDAKPAGAETAAAADGSGTDGQGSAQG